MNAWIARRLQSFKTARAPLQRIFLSRLRTDWGKPCFNRKAAMAFIMASVFSSHALASRNFVYAQAKAGIFISLSRVMLNRRSTRTSFRSSPTIKVTTLLTIWPVAAR